MVFPLSSLSLFIERKTCVSLPFKIEVTKQVMLLQLLFPYKQFFTSSPLLNTFTRSADKTIVCKLARLSLLSSCGLPLFGH